MQWALCRLFLSADGYRPGNIRGFVREITANGKWSEKDPQGKTEKIPTRPCIILIQFWDGKWRVFCSCLHWEQPHTDCHTLRCLAQLASLNPHHKNKLQWLHKHWTWFPVSIFNNLKENVCYRTKDQNYVCWDGLVKEFTIKLSIACFHPLYPRMIYYMTRAMNIRRHGWEVRSPSAQPMRSRIDCFQSGC